MTQTIDNMIDTVIHGDNLEVMGGMPDNYVDTVITDPPYGLGFMGKGWDTFKPDFINEVVNKDKRAPTRIARQQRSNTAGTYDPSRNAQFQAWCTVWAKECLRVAKPGAILMAFGGTRTYHRLTCAIEDAGWEIRDCIQWIYGSGFPKSLDISKAIDKAAGAEREVVGKAKHGACNKPDGNTFSDDAYEWQRFHDITTPATELAQQWDGWGTALKPSWEPIIVAMKPLDGTYTENAEKWGVAGLWIDGGRIEAADGDYDHPGNSEPSEFDGNVFGFKDYDKLHKQAAPHPKGRFPSNTILSCTCEGEHEPDCPVRMLDEQSGDLQSSKPGIKHAGNTGAAYGAESRKPGTQMGGHNDSGGASRFFYCAKSSRAERNAGCEGMEAKIKDDEYRQPTGNAMVDRIHGCGKRSYNHHPTVKPLALMEYLCKLTKTPTGGIVLDPFAGSGTTGMAAYRTGRRYILIEKEAEYAEIARARIQHEKDLMGLFPE